MNEYKMVQSRRELTNADLEALLVKYFDEKNIEYPKKEGFSRDDKWALELARNNEIVLFANFTFRTWQAFPCARMGFGVSRETYTLSATGAWVTDSTSVARSIVLAYLIYKKVLPLEDKSTKKTGDSVEKILDDMGFESPFVTDPTA